MTLTRKLLALSAAAALSFCFAACDDDGGSSQNGGSCTAAQNTCKSGTVASVCNAATGQMTDTPCGENQKCAGGRCVDNPKQDDPEVKDCAPGAHTCEGAALLKCKDDGKGYEKVKDCAAPEPICNAELKKCEAECEPDFKACKTSKAKMFCENGLNKEEDCPGGTICDEQTGECKAECDSTFVAVCDGDRIKSCDGGKFKYVDCKAGEERCDVEKAECVPLNAEVLKDSVIGTPCKCEGADCTFKITGKELKSALKDMNGLYSKIKGDECKGAAAFQCGLIDAGIAAIVPTYLNKIPDDGYIEAPDFFSASSQNACKDVTAPTGMVVGCLRDSKIDLSHLNLTNAKETGLLDEVGGLIDMLGNIPEMNEKLAAVGGKEGLLKIINAIKGMANDGISFQSPNGYCLASDIEIALAVTDPVINSIIDMEKVKSMIDKINTKGTSHKDAKNAVCPAGSSLVWYDVHDGGGAEDKGEANVGFDMCLKTCKTDDDCKREGVADPEGAYKCIDMPYGTSEDVAAKTKVAHVCFAQANIEYFTGLETTFEALLPKEEGDAAGGN